MKARAIFAVSALILATGCDHAPQTDGANPFESDTGISSEVLLPYPDALESLANRRQALQAAYENAATAPQKDAVIDEARRALCSGMLFDLMPHWMGTPWSFGGTTETPGDGQIACGYFVTTVLRDAGVDLQRVHLAQQASEVMIKALVSEEHIKRYSNTPIDRFVESIRQWGPGLYVVGLDNHTGFIIHESTDVSFVHSSYAEPKEVISEPALESAILASSKYRVLGKLSGDPIFLTNWVLGPTNK